MDYTTVILMAFGLAMDCFAVSMAKSTSLGRVSLPNFFAMALSFGIFQGLMPLIGFAAGISFADAIAAYDHWIAFGILAAIGIKMITDDVRQRRNCDEDKPAGGQEPECNKSYGIGIVLLLSVATSIDALATGLVFITTPGWIFRAVLIIGMVSFAMSLTGSRRGSDFGKKIKFRVNRLGGIVLIAIGIKILVEHTFPMM